MGLLWKQEEEKMKYKLDEILTPFLFAGFIILLFVLFVLFVLLIITIYN